MMNNVKTLKEKWGKLVQHPWFFVGPYALLFILIIALPVLVAMGLSLV